MSCRTVKIPLDPSIGTPAIVASVMHTAFETIRAAPAETRRHPARAGLPRVLLVALTLVVAAQASFAVYRSQCAADHEHGANLAAAQETNRIRLRRVFDARTVGDAASLREGFAERQHALQQERTRLKQTADSTYQGPVGREGERRELRRGLSTGQLKRRQVIDTELAGLARAQRLLDVRWSTTPQDRPSNLGE